MHLFIVNPVAGKGRTQQVWATVKERLDHLHISYQVEFTKYAGNAREITATAIKNPHLEAVIAIGGDGTVHEVANGMVGSKIPFGYIPAGTGNDFAISSHIPRKDPLLALERILQHQPHPIDTVQVGDRVAICNLGIGFDGKVSEMVSKSNWKRWLGRFAYTYGVIQALRHYQPTRLSLTIDGETYEYNHGWLVAICNIATYGGGMRICPDATQDDGLLDICCVKDVSALELLRVFPLVYKGKHTSHPSVTLHRGKEIQIQSDDKLIIHADGEMIGETPVTIKIRPASLWVL